MICVGAFFIRRHIHRKKKRAALNDEAMQSDSSSEMPGAKDNEHNPMRSIEPRPLTWGDNEGGLRDPSQKQMEILQGAAGTIVNVKATDLPGSASLGNIRELEATSRPDDGLAELPGGSAPDVGTRGELEAATVRYDQKPPKSSHSHHRDVFVDAPERMTPRHSMDDRRQQPTELGAT
ncbi:hypothetical protein PG999_013998 [Apiospora kogelbergensis]|uniref:Uncharacterized protein n=1 Tax=Apiospora kogelbergensis TaxID=1337665 RepID=A0AAW0Q5Z6_9PEZI